MSCATKQKYFSFHVVNAYYLRTSPCSVCFFKPPKLTSMKQLHDVDIGKSKFHAPRIL